MYNLLTFLAFKFAIHNSLASPSSSDAWGRLNITLQGRLQASVPFSRPCFPIVDKGVLGSFNPEECQAVKNGYLNHTVRASHFGSYMNTQWETCQSEGKQCLLDGFNITDPKALAPQRTCSQGDIPPYYVKVNNAADVRAALDFSKQNNIRLVIKNTGHDYIGRSAAPNSLALWMNGLQSVSHVPSFIEEGCQSNAGVAQQAVTFGAGVTHGTLYDFAESMNITLPGGADATVGAAGGYLQGGGHSALSNAYGLAVDRVLQFKVITADGQERVANRCQNTDLFFALRGGGGGTFGVVLEVTMKALPKMVFPTVSVFFDGTDENRNAFMKFVIDNALSYAKQGWGGYISPRKNIIFVNTLLNATEAAASMESLRVFATDVLKAEFNLVMEPSWLTFYEKYIVPNPVPVGLPFTTSSRLIPSKSFTSEAEKKLLFDRLISIFDSNSLVLIFAVAPFYYKNSTGTSITGAWRDSLWHITASAVWNFDTPTSSQKAIYNNLTSNMDPLRQITPSGGAYQNEADVYEPNFESSFWGEHYSQLVQIKRKYDPAHLLDCWHCVDWKGAKDSRYQCYI